MIFIKSEVYFTTGDFAKLCEVTKQTLFHYDSIGLLQPHHKDEKGYRYYSHVQFDTMYVIESLKEMEMPLREIKEFINDTTPKTMISLFKEKSKQISEKITHLQSIQNTIEKKIALTELAGTLDFSEIYISEADATYFYLSEPLINDNDKNRMAIAEFYRLCVSQLNEKYSIGGMIKKNDLLREEVHSYKYLFAKTEYTDALPLTLKEKTKQVTAYHTGKYEAIAKTYSKIFDFIEEHQLKITDYAYEEPILDRISVNDSENYVTKIMIPVH